MRIKYCLGLHIELAESKKKDKQRKRFLYKLKLKLGVSSLDKRRW